jgi:hypothetical protein
MGDPLKSDILFKLENCFIFNQRLHMWFPVISIYSVPKHVTMIILCDVKSERSGKEKQHIGLLSGINGTYNCET